MADATTRTLNWYESEADAENIKSNGWQFQVAKSVATASNQPTYNIVWQSQALAPTSVISWNVQYALGWTAAVPTNGVKITIEGDWQACNPGEAFDIDENGYWQPSTSGGKAGWLSVGEVNYSYPGVLGIHIVIAVYNVASNQYEAVWVDQVTMPPGSSGSYQPQEMVSWWLEGGDQTGQVFSNSKSMSTTYDFSNPSDPVTNAYDWSTSYLFQSGSWAIAAGDPPRSFLSPPPSAGLAPLTLGGQPPIVIQIDYAKWLIKFAPAGIGATVLTALATALATQLKSKFPTWKSLTVTIEGSNGDKLSVKYEKGGGNAQGTIGYLGTPLGAPTPQDGIKDALTSLQKSGSIPSKETWTVTPDNSAEPGEAGQRPPPRRPCPPPRANGEDVPPSKESRAGVPRQPVEEEYPYHHPPPGRQDQRYPSTKTPFSNSYAGTPIATNA